MKPSNNFCVYALGSGLLIFILNLGCAHHKDVRPGADGIHRFTMVTDDAEGAARKGIKEANHYCKEQGKSPAFLTEESKYTGDMPEDKYKTMKTIGKAGQIAGGTVWAVGGAAGHEAASALGGISGIGGAVVSGIAGEGYTVEMKFKCQ
jgi:hypothetical protein